MSGTETRILTDERRKRIKILKKIIIYAILSAIATTSVLCIVLMILLSGMRKQIMDLEERLLLQEQYLLSMFVSGLDPDEIAESIETSIFFTAQLEESGRSNLSRAGELNGQAAQKKVYLTFDDGPSSNTGRILDILAEYDVKATFFVVGRTDEKSLDSYRRIVAEGHTLGMHSYSHQYQEIYRSVEAFSEDLLKLQELLYIETGVWSRYYRFPGGSSNTVSGIDMQELIEYLTAQNITYFDWNIASGDAATTGNSAWRIANNCISGLGDKAQGIILMHDAADKNSTVEALPAIIERIIDDESSVLLPIGDETLPVQHIMYQASDIGN
jgi:peptidoglycan/xylan/chitin deacetylase (PgdA/CDA1 family)